jgi:hypothetical protein
MLVSDVIFNSFLDMGAVAPGETLTAAESADAFARLNMLLSSWSTEGITVPSLLHGPFTVAAGTNNYTFGVGGTLATTSRPIRVTGAQSVSGNFRMGMKVMSFDQFAQEVSDPIASASVLAEVLAADGSFPLINLRVHPMPAALPGILWLDYWAAIAQFVTVGDTLNLPDGWPDALHFNLALALLPQYGRAGGADPMLLQNAKRTKDALNNLYAQINPLPQGPPQPQQQGGQ